MRRCCLLLVCLLLLTGCGRADTQDVSSFAPAEGDRLVIFTSHKETIYEPILKEFEQRTGIWVELETGGTVTLLERIAAGESGADLMFGGGADSLSAYSACFAPYVSEYAGDVAPEYDLGGGIWTPFSALPVVLIYNTKLVRQNPPERWADLLDAGWRGRIAFADPTVSGSSCTALGTLLQAVGGNTDNTLAAFFRNLDGRIIADSGGVVPAVADGSCYVGVTLEENGVCRFPDAPTQRGARHLRELTLAREQGYDAAVLFVIQMAPVRYLTPNDWTDPEFGKALREAAAKGVAVLAVDCVVTPDTMTIGNPVAVHL